MTGEGTGERAGERRSPLREIEEGGGDDEGGKRGQVSIRYRKMIIECEECGIAHTPIKALRCGYGIIPICPKCKKEAKAIGAIEAYSFLFNDDGRRDDEFAILSQANRWIENCDRGGQATLAPTGYGTEE